MMKLIRLDCLISQDVEDLFSAFLFQNASWGWEVEQSDNGLARFIVYLDTEAAADGLKQSVQSRWPQARCAATPFEDRDWSVAWREFFTPLRILDVFVVVPPWRTGTEDIQGLTPLVIEPKMAFGTGHHATTTLCLEAVTRLWQEAAITDQTRFLDLGTGSGILALACARLGMHGLAVDIDPVAVSNALENRHLNQADDHVDIRRGGLEIVEKDRRFGLILANILSGPLVRMAADIVSLLEQGGCLVLSGILADQAARVENAYIQQGLPAPCVLARGEWTALAWGVADKGNRFGPPQTGQPICSNGQT